MQGSQQKKELISELNEEQSAIGNLKENLNKLMNSKEDAIKQKVAISSEIKHLIKKSKDLKKVRNSLTNDVRDLKTKRREFNSSIRSKIIEVKKVNDEKRKIVKEKGIQTDPEKILKEIQRMEFSIETDGLNFEKEKALMKKINAKKKEFQDFKGAYIIFEKCSKLSKDIDASKREAEKIHKDIQEKARKSQSIHERILEIGNEVDLLVAKEKILRSILKNVKGKFKDANENLKDELGKVRGIKDKLDSISADIKKKKKEKETVIIKEKEKEVEEKIKAGKKITTEDLLVFQRNELTKKSK